MAFLVHDLYGQNAFIQPNSPEASDKVEWFDVGIGSILFRMRRYELVQLIHDAQEALAASSGEASA